MHRHRDRPRAPKIQIQNGVANAMPPLPPNRRQRRRRRSHIMYAQYVCTLARTHTHTCNTRTLAHHRKARITRCDATAGPNRRKLGKNKCVCAEKCVCVRARACMLTRVCVCVCPKTRKTDSRSTTRSSRMCMLRAFTYTYIFICTLTHSRTHASKLAHTHTNHGVKSSRAVRRLRPRMRVCVFCCVCCSVGAFDCELTVHTANASRECVRVCVRVKSRIETPQSHHHHHHFLMRLR